MRYLALVICIVSLLLSVCDIFKPPTTVNFDGFRKAVKHAIDKSQETDIIKPLTDKSTSLDCHMPPSAIILTLSNFYTVELFALQHKGLTIWNLKECIESRFVSVCLDEKCMTVCKDSSINNCYLLPIETMASDFMQNSFRYLMYLKHELMHEALKVVDEVLFFDVDVILFLNPWPDTLYRRHMDGTRDTSVERAEMMWQPEWKYDMSCAGTPNGGQLYVRNTTRVQKFYQSFFALKEDFLGQGKTDQDIMLELAQNASLIVCSLPYTRFTGFNLYNNAPFNKTARLMDVVAYHTSGVTGLKRKVDHILNVYKGVESKNPAEHAESWI